MTSINHHHYRPHHQHHMTKFLFLCTLFMATIFPSCKCSSNSSKLGVHMIRSPESTIAPLRDEVLFECELNLSPDRLEWRFRSATSNGLSDDYLYLTKNDRYNITTFDGTSKLRVYVNQNSVGEYQCVAWFGASALASIPARLTLAAISLDNKTSLNSSSEDGTTLSRNLPLQIVHWKVHPGNSILIKCGDVVSNPAPAWSFFKDDSPVPTSVPQLSSGSLILQSITSEHSGMYSCSAVNSITGNEIKLRQKIELVVESTAKSAPKFLVSPVQKFAVKPGATAILECPGVANPIPKAVWSRPDAAIYNNRTTVLNYGLQILDVMPDDRGMYVCRLDNGITPVLVHTIQLEVQEMPSITDGPQETLTNEGDSLELRCMTRGYPQPIIYWMINGADTKWDPLIKSNGSSLVIETVQKKHAGIVQCFAKNDAGEVNFSNLLQVKPKQISGELGLQPLGTFPQTTRANDHTGKPAKGHKKHKHTMIPPSRPSITRLSDNKVMVRWTVPAKGGLPISFFKVQYRVLGDTSKKVPRTIWMTDSEDILPEVRMYELDNLKPDHYYRFRIAAVYSNNDNKLSNVSTKFLLQRGSQLGPFKSNLIAPNLTRVEAISETAIVLHWLFPSRPTSPVDGFYAYYRKASTAGEYMKATVDGMQTRHFKIDHLEPGTAYEFKLQSFTASAASDFLAIITGKTLKPSTPPPLTDTSENETTVNTSKSYLPLIAGGTGGGSLLLFATILACVCMKRRNADRDDDANENKAHPDHIQAEPNGFAGANGRGGLISSPIHKSSRLNGVVPRMNITSNPLAQDGDKNRNVMELRFLPVAAVQQNNNHTQPGDAQHRRTLERSTRNLQYAGGTAGDGTNKMLHNDNGVNASSMRRTRRTSGSGPGSPRVVRGVSSELLHNRSPMPVRAHNSKRNRLGSRTENMSSGSLNSIEV
ncbi:interference hedgehog isoform X1 [Bradysia coprophila]|uniref:interference hedgehog isoform X1 n=1 Tax=Bradysia coprophila TaxID=38358 RepID=UPI00187DAB4B|nr:interference hedgehog isoform X1 [Bradysia coprophila]